MQIGSPLTFRERESYGGATQAIRRSIEKLKESLLPLEAIVEQKAL